MSDTDDCRGYGNEIEGVVTDIEFRPQLRRRHKRTTAAYIRRCAEKEDQ
jgi:hypothetical protein